MAVIVLDTNNSYSIMPGVTKILGRHTFKIGAELRRMEFNFAQTTTASGFYNFDNLMTSINPFSPGNAGTQLRTPPLVPDANYIDWRYTNSMVGPWTELNFHYGKHHKTYVETLNKLIVGTEFADMPLEKTAAVSPSSHNARRSSSTSRLGLLKRE